MAAIGVALLLLVAVVIAGVALWRPPAPDLPVSTEAPVDGLGPTVVSAVAVSGQTIDLVFTESVDPDTVQVGDFAVNTGLAITGAVLRPDGRTVRLTSALQKAGFPYAVGCVAGSVTDTHGNGNVEPNIAKFAGFGATGGTLRVTHAPIKDRPGGAVAKRPGNAATVEAYRLSAVDGDVRVAGITLRGIDSGDALYTDVAEVWLFGDNGDGAMRTDGSDRQLSQNRAFTGSRSGSSVTFGDLQIAIPMGGHVDIWVVLRIGPMAGTGRSVGVEIRDGDIRTAAGRVAPFGRLSSAADGNTIVVDARGPVMDDAQAVDRSHVDVTFSDVLDPATVRRTDFYVNAVRPNRASVQRDGRTVRLTLSRPIDVKTVKVAYSFGALQDLAGNPSMAGGSFTILGYTARAGSQDSTAPTIAGMVTATTGTVSPRVAMVNWNSSFDSNGVAGYRVWRSSNPATGFSAVGATSTAPYPDRSGIPGVTYYYRVTAFDTYQNESAVSAPSNGVMATWTVVPHKQTYGSGNACDLCHVPHQAATARGIFRGVDASTSGETGICFDCHDGSGAVADVRNGATDSFALASGHSVENLGEVGDLSDDCSDCHSTHRDPYGRPGLWRDDVAGVTITGRGDQWCLACHKDGATWSPSGYPEPATPSRDATGYPVLGTFPGESVYRDPSKNAHALIASTAPGPDAAGCLLCHSAHRGVNAYDGLREQFRPPTAATLASDQTSGAYAALCLACHGGDPSWVATGATDIARFVTGGPSGNAGHRILTAGGTLPVGSPLPCYDCHNPHGSTRGNQRLLADTLNGSLETSSASGVRALCLSCHTTSDGMVWESESATYVAVSPTMTVEGLRRDGTVGHDSVNALLLPAYSGAHESTATDVTCYRCHGNDYVSRGGNVHAPSGGASKGGVSCYGPAGTGCHSPYRRFMEDSVGTSVGTSNTATAHHVLGGTFEGDYAPSSAPYPGLDSTSAPSVYCVSCHVDHDVFNADNGANLRSSIATGVVVATNTDFYARAPWGICISCHSVTLPRDIEDQAPATSSVTPAIDGTAFASSAHSYAVDAIISGSPFSARCVKCHDDETSTRHQETADHRPGFAMHYSAQERILAALGLPTSPGFAEERLCYRCHSRASDAVGGTTKTDDASDWYGSAPMRDPATGIYDAMQGAFGHKVGAYSGIHRASLEETLGRIAEAKHVECGDCHDVHASAPGTRVTGTNAISGPLSGATGVMVDYTESNWTGPASSSYLLTASASAEYQVCFKCHSGANAGLASWDSSWTDVGLEFSPYNRSGHPVVTPLDDHPGSLAPRALSADAMRSPWKAVGAQSMYCSDCHAGAQPGALGPHGSSVKWMLSGPNRAWPYDSASGNGGSTGAYRTLGTANLGSGTVDGLFCQNCHVVGNDDVLRMNRAHTGNQHQTAACVDCHLRVPHGGKVSCLIAAVGDSGEYPAGMPARYAADGAGGRASGSSVAIARFFKPLEPVTMTRGSCYATGEDAAGVSCHAHEDASSPAYTSGEQW